MVAHMNAEALAKTIETGQSHFWSRSRQELWLKGETSGTTQQVQECVLTVIRMLSGLKLAFRVLVPPVIQEWRAAFIGALNQLMVQLDWFVTILRPSSTRRNIW